MIGPAGGNGFPNLHIILFVATLVVLGLAGLVVLLRLARRRRPVMGRSVRVLGAVAAVIFAWYLLHTTERRQVMAALDDVVDVLELDSYPGFSQASSASGNSASCGITGANQTMITTGASIDRLGNPEPGDMPLAADFDLLETLAARAEDEGWDVRRFVDEQQLQLYAESGGAAFVADLFPRRRFVSLSVTLDSCLQFNFVQKVDNPDEFDTWIEVESFGS